MSYNTHLFFTEGTRGENNLVEVRDLISDSGASIIGLQESEGNRMVSSNQQGVKWLANELGMHYYNGPDSKDDVWGVSLLSEYPILSQKTVLLPSENALNRVVIVGKLDLPQNYADITVLVTHLSFQSPNDQLNQIESIIDITNDINGPFILMGDFNLVLAQQLDNLPLEQDPSFITLNGTYRDGWIEAGGSFDESTSYPFLDDPTVDNSRIDYIWLSPEWTVVTSSAQIHGNRDVSDHRAIEIEIML
jgi:endonuclease/exonuclease/phosphatase family metal-dependent hydrolase